MTLAPHSVQPDRTLQHTIAVTLSIVIAMYNEEPALDALFAKLQTTLDALGETYEIICVNDGSRDNTLAKLLQHRSQNNKICIVNLSRNFGKEAALSAGLAYARGAAIIPLDADLQDPPELIGEFLQHWRHGYDVVYGTRRTRKGESWTKIMSAHVFYRLYNALSPLKIPVDTGDFRLLDRRVVEVIKQLPESNRFMKGLFQWVGFKSIGVPYTRHNRVAGTTSWNYIRLWNFALDGITSFSTLPLRVWTYLGFSLAFLSFMYAIFLTLRTLLFDNPVPGYPSLMTVMLFMSGIQLIGLGVIGEYMGRLFVESKRRPVYIVNQTYGLQNNAQDATPLG